VFKVLNSRRIYDGRIINLRVDEVERDNGRRSIVEVVEHGGGVAILAAPQPGTVVLVRQYRHATGRAVWEVPAGKIDPGEDPAASAARELEEETGYRCAGVRRLWSFFTSPGFCNELLHLYVAEGLSPGTPSPEDEEAIETRVFAVGDAWAMVERDELPDAKTQIALAWLRQNQ
jgi:ADP-ribose pyrophosphatase